MLPEPETFISLSGLAWSAISSIATVLAVIVALFLPFYSVRKKKSNLSKLIEKEIDFNIELLKKASLCKDENLDGTHISRLNIMCTILSKIDLNVWNDNKQTIAEVSSSRFMKYSEINKRLDSIKEYAVEIIKTEGRSLYIHLIDGEVLKCLQLIDDKKLLNKMKEKIVQFLHHVN